MTIVVPPAFVRATVAREGDAGRRWIAQLPEQVEMLCAQWGLVCDGAPMHGYLGLVIPVRRGSERCVLKVSWREATSESEAVALAAWQGRGAVRLLAVDLTAGAMLLERLDERRSLHTLAIGQAIDVAGRLQRRLAIPAPAGVRSLAAVAAELQQLLPERWVRSGQPMPRRLVDRACALARELAPAASPGPASRLVNYDLHYDNVLAGEREPWLAVDPKVVAGDLEFGIAQLLWCRWEEIEAEGGLARHFQALVDAAELDRVRARHWTLVRCVDYWLWGIGAGLTQDPARCAAIVAQLI